MHTGPSLVAAAQRFFVHTHAGADGRTCSTVTASSTYSATDASTTEFESEVTQAVSGVTAVCESQTIETPCSHRVKCATKRHGLCSQAVGAINVTSLNTTTSTTTAASTTCTPVITAQLRSYFYLSSAEALQGCSSGTLAAFSNLGLNISCVLESVGVGLDTDVDLPSLLLLRDRVRDGVDVPTVESTAVTMVAVGGMAFGAVSFLCCCYFCCLFCLCGRRRKKQKPTFTPEDAAQGRLVTVNIMKQVNFAASL